MTDDQRKRRGPFVGCLAITILLGLPAYVLSIGPYSWLLAHGYASKWLGLIYKPLELATKICPPLRSFVDSYIELWL